MGGRFDVEQRKVTEILGSKRATGTLARPSFGMSQRRSDPENSQYVPTTWPGARLPHVWLDRSVTPDNAATTYNPATTHNLTALHDHLGTGYRCCGLGNARRYRNSGESLERDRRASEVLDIRDEAAREIYGFDLVVVRPITYCLAW